MVPSSSTPRRCSTAPTLWMPTSLWVQRTLARYDAECVTGLKCAHMLRWPCCIAAQVCKPGKASRGDCVVQKGARVGSTPWQRVTVSVVNRAEGERFGVVVVVVVAVSPHSGSAGAHCGCCRPHLSCHARPRLRFLRRLRHQSAARRRHGQTRRAAPTLPRVAWVQLPAVHRPLDPPSLCWSDAASVALRLRG
jgi:hypothetical protein